MRPEPDEESGPYWDGLGRHQVILQQCGACGAIRFPPMPTCPRCAAEGGTPVESPAAGVVYSFVRVHRAFSAEHATEVPYTVAVVELDEGCRMLGRIAGGQPAAVGDRVSPTFADREGWTELQFQVSATSDTAAPDTAAPDTAAPVTEAGRAPTAESGR